MKESKEVGGGPVARTGRQADSVMPDLAAYIAGATGRALPEDVVEKTKQHLLDTLAAMLSGSRLRPGRLALAYVRAQGGRREACVAGSRFLTTAGNAALANGMSAHADETDDSHLRGQFHPGCAVVPAALAMAERAGCDGGSLLRAVALGYDIGCRFNLSLGLARPYGARHSTHSLGALFGATAAAGALAGLDAHGVRHLLSYAVQQASGVPSWMRDPGHVEKAFDFGGMAARNGVAAATMVAAGFSGVDDILAGDASFFTAFAETPRPEALLDGLGTRHEIMAATIKRWCVGSPIQAALDSLVVIMRDHGVRAANVERLIVRLPDDRAHIVDNRTMPDVCVQHILAVALIDGGLGFASAHDEARTRDPAVLALRRRITLVPSPELTLARPPRQAIIEVSTHDGRRLTHRTHAVRGTPDNPMDRAEVAAKACDLAGPVVGSERARALVDRVWTVERLTNARDLRPLIQARA